MPQRLSAEDERKALQAGHAAIADYLRQMGISVDLLAAASAVRPEALRFLTRAEIAAFGIDRRQAVEGAWTLVDTPDGANAAKLIEARDEDAGLFRRALVSLVCRDQAMVRLQYVREVGAETPSAVFRLVAGGRSVPLMGCRP